jgi:hypothetical protein
MTVIDTAPVHRATLPAPQSIGVFDGPAALVVLPDVDGVAALLADLAVGRVPSSWPFAAAVLSATLADDVDAALAHVDDLERAGHVAVAAVNRLVLAPTSAHLDVAREAVAGDADLRLLVDAVAYSSGLSDDPPAIPVDGVRPEFAVLGLTVRAARAIEFKDPVGAERAFTEAITTAAEVGPALQGRVAAMLADHLKTRRAPGETVLAAYDEAIRLLTATDLDEVRADLHLERGMVAHQMADGQRHRLVEAIRSYQSALLTLGETSHPDRFALANMNVAIAILALPMTQASDQVRLGVAVQSLRAALRIYRPESHPYEWSSCQMNLANALQYLPSKHREDNLAEAVELYEAVLAVRSPRSDPLGYARVLANQANALAHLAVFDHARAKYAEARALFATSGEPDAVEIVDRQIAEIDAAEAAREVAS